MRYSRAHGGWQARRIVNFQSAYGVRLRYVVGGRGGPVVLLSTAVLSAIRNGAYSSTKQAARPTRSGRATSGASGRSTVARSP
jgi:hypothetical protein